MLLTVVLATATAGPNAISLSGSGGFPLGPERPPSTHEGDVTELGELAGGRIQWSRTLEGHMFIGAVVGVEFIRNFYRQSTVLLVGPTAGVHWGDTVGGGFRFAGGYAYGGGKRVGLPTSTSGGNRPLYKLTSTGVFFDCEAEFSLRPSARLELFVDVPIVLLRSFTATDTSGWSGDWWYASVILPLAATAGARFYF
jgi:hypothetical protein